MSRTFLGTGALWYRCRDFVTEQSQGEWSDKDIADDTDKLVVFVLGEVNRVLADSN